MVFLVALTGRSLADPCYANPAETLDGQPLQEAKETLASYRDVDCATPEYGGMTFLAIVHVVLFVAAPMMCAERSGRISADRSSASRYLMSH